MSSARKHVRQKAVFLFCFGLIWASVGVSLVIPPHQPRAGYWVVCAGFLAAGVAAMVCAVLGRTRNPVAWYGLYLMGGYAAVDSLITFLSGSGIHDVHVLLSVVSDAALMLAVGAVSNMREADGSLDEKVADDERH